MISWYLYDEMGFQEHNPHLHASYCMLGKQGFDLWQFTLRLLMGAQLGDRCVGHLYA